MLKLPTSPQVEASHYPPELWPNDEESVGPFVPPTQISAPYTVLPPIGRANGSDIELCSDRSEQQLNPVHRSSSEGYLSQMEKHNQLKTKTNYKVCICVQLIFSVLCVHASFVQYDTFSILKPDTAELKTGFQIHLKYLKISKYNILHIYNMYFFTV